MRKEFRDLVIGLVLGTMIVLSAPAHANHQLSHLEPARATHNHDPYWYDFDDSGCSWKCYSNSKLDDRMKDALNNPTPPYDQKGWTALGLTDAVFWAHSPGNGTCHAAGLGTNCSHHRSNMVTFDYDCAVDWTKVASGDLTAIPSSIHPAPNGNCIGGTNSVGAVGYFAYQEHTAAPYGAHDQILGAHIYLKAQKYKSWTYTTGCCTTGYDVWAVLEHEFGHVLGALGHWNENDNTYCPDDPNSNARLTMCQSIPSGYWKQRTPELKDRNAMDFSYPD